MAGRRGPRRRRGKGEGKDDARFRDIPSAALPNRWPGPLRLPQGLLLILSEEDELEPWWVKRAWQKQLKLPSPAVDAPARARSTVLTSIRSERRAMAKPLPAKPP